MLQNIIDFCNYWWFRYLMVTELYMVEKWERVTIHVIFAVLFCLFWYFNYSVLLSFTGNILGITPISTIIDQQGSKIA
ncbi:PREDICTED: uncharacterized protein LOC108978669 [Bactrocera latifrons]|uniref:Uncharacterized protein LOC105229081 n=1 Tax=Bactrocera dorsalis TaxID=27457 RepID=A0A6I9VAZ7_BACDO|nr:uncharacterized protein LOC105229081 [Bactrocera dorsalis]XP_018804611.1 PREDICTED: uncharacterized protein LOC108978669 [Bactrocera latifrons]XP_039966106.1 uncharacterized protein LOC120778385 [Bactrocera tryoni]XP_050333161.1 uncharacterized protein LOC126761218 [Bactrocera neohumeralis]